MFLRNERSLDVKSGTLGTIEQVSERHMDVRTEDGRSVSFDTKDYANIDHGYAATVDKAHGMTVDRVHVLATPGMDSHSAYVALSRHRVGLELHYGRDGFADKGRLVRTLSRDRVKDMASDYERADPADQFAEGRGIPIREGVAEIARKAPEKVRGLFDGIRPPNIDQSHAAGIERSNQPPEQTRGIFANLRPTVPAIDPVRAAEVEAERGRQAVIERHARAVSVMWKMEDQGLPVLPHQKVEFNKTRQALSVVGKHAAKDIERAYVRDPALVQEAANGRVQRALQAMRLEAEIRADPQRRTDPFVETWRKLDQRRHADYIKGDNDAMRHTRDRMGAMAKSLERDPQVESTLRNRRQALGIKIETGRRLSHDLASSVGIGLGRGRGIGL